MKRSKQLPMWVVFPLMRRRSGLLVPERKIVRPRMAAYVQSASTTGNAQSPTITLNNVGAHNFIGVGVGILSGDGTTTVSNGGITVSDGTNTYLHPASLFTNGNSAGAPSDDLPRAVQILYAYNVVAGSYTLTATFPVSGQFFFAAAEYSGVQTGADPLDLATTNATTGTDVNTGALSPTINELCLAFFGEWDVATTWTVNNSFNERQSSANDGHCDGSLSDLIGSGSQTADWTLASGANAGGWCAAMGTFALENLMPQILM